jgi:hypothetical protein
MRRFFQRVIVTCILTLCLTGRGGSAQEVLSPCASREPPLSTCSEFAAACVAYFNSPVAPNDTLRSKMVDLDANSCIGWKNKCLNSGMWQGPNCVIINIQRR